MERWSWDDDDTSNNPVLDNIVDTFIHLIAADSTLEVFFDGIDMKSLNMHQKRLLSMAFAKMASSAYLQKTIQGHHQHLFSKGLNESHYDLMV